MSKPYRRTKMVCTLGPSVNSYEKICELIDAGMNVARINFSHGNYDVHAKVIADLKKARENLKSPLAIMLDTKGPEVRVEGIIKDQIQVRQGDLLYIKPQDTIQQDNELSITPKVVLDNLKEGMMVLFADGFLTSKVVSIDSNGYQIRVLNDGVIKNRNGVNIPETEFDIPAVTEKDINDIKFGCEHDIDVIAASFIHSADQVLEIKQLLADQGQSAIKIIAKIECFQGVKNFESIVQVSDGIMVARGDLGVELPLEQVPSLQKKFIMRCLQLSKPVIIATQMLESMIGCPRPTRAEVSDVANAIYDATSAVMLSGETAAGRYPIESAKTMAKIAQETEKEFQYEHFLKTLSNSGQLDVSSAVTQACVQAVYNAKAKGIVVSTKHGRTAEYVSRCKPSVPVIAVTNQLKTYHQLSLCWGVIPVLANLHSVREAIEHASHFAMENELLDYGDLIVITSGTPFGVSGSTNTMLIEYIGDVVVRGECALGGSQVYGEIAIVLKAHEKEYYHTKNKIVVMPKCDENFLPLLKDAKAIILYNHPDDHESEKHAQIVAKTLHIPLIVRADGAISALKESQFVTLDPEKGIVFKGSLKKEDKPKNC